MLLCNVDSMIVMTRAVLPKMYKRKRGLIINVGSLAAETEPVYMSTYSAGKVTFAPKNRILHKKDR